MVGLINVLFIPYMLIAFTGRIYSLQMDLELRFTHHICFFVALTDYGQSLGATSS